MPETRLDRESYFALLARLVALRSTCNRAKVGAILTKNGRIISAGYAGSPAGTPHCIDVGCTLDNTGSCIRTIHAEANAIAEAARLGINISDAIIYCTLCPCVNCAKLITAAHLSAVYYLDDYSKSQGSLEYLRDAGITVIKLEEKYEINLSVKKVQG